jgi:hypothetical protein
MERKQIEGYPGYFINPNGEVISKRFGKVLKTRLNSAGYVITPIRSDGKEKQSLTHRLVAKTFIPNPNNYPQVNHINGIKTDNRVENLEWTTRSGNAQHALKTGLRKAGEQHLQAKISNAEVIEIRRQYIPKSKHFNQFALADRFGVSQITISKIIRNQHRKTI